LPGQVWDFADIIPGGDAASWADPPDGIVSSANERPDRDDISLGYFFSPPDRAQRIRALLAAPGPRTEADMHALQRDVLHPAALTVRDELLALLPTGPSDFRAALESWDGRYDTTSTGALAHELLIGALMKHLFTDGGPPGYQAVWGTRLLLLAEMRALRPEVVRAAVAAILPRVTRNWQRWRTWGRVHRYRPAHHFGALPALGWRFRTPPFPAPGGDDTLHKSAHGLVTKPHYVGFGACARHVSDLADPNANRFVLLGGNDGWLGSENCYDQLRIWQRGEYVTVPLRCPAVSLDFVHETFVRP
jgi:penicillin G amidase